MKCTSNRGESSTAEFFIQYSSVDLKDISAISFTRRIRTIINPNDLTPAKYLMSI